MIKYFSRQQIINLIIFVQYPTYAYEDQNIKEKSEQEALA